MKSVREHHLKRSFRFSAGLVVLLLSTGALAQAENQPLTNAAQQAEKPLPAPIGLILDPSTIPSGAIVIAGQPNRIHFAGKLCTVTRDRGLTIGPSATVLEIDPARRAPGWTEVTWVGPQQTCNGDARRFRIAFANDLPGSSLPEHPTIWFDSGIAELQAKTITLEPYQLLSLVDGTLENATACPENHLCSHTLGAGFLKNLDEHPEATGLILWPADIPLEMGRPLPRVVNRDGKERPFRELTLGPSTVVFGNGLIEAGKLDTSEERHLIRGRFLRAIDRITCNNAECRLTRKGILLFDVDLTAPAIRLGYSLKAGFAFKDQRKESNSQTVTLKLERCAIKPPKDVPLLAGTENHVYFVKIPRECTQVEPGALELNTRPPSRTYVRSEIESSDPAIRILEVVVDRVPSTTDRMSLTLFERVSVLRRLGAVTIPIATNYRPVQVRFEVQDIGFVDFIPSNRPARLSFAFSEPIWLERFSVEPRPGFYGVSRQADAWTVLGEAGVSGNIPVRFAYRPAALASFLGVAQDANTPARAIAHFDTEGVYPVRNINVPMSLVTRKTGEDLFQVVCGIRGDEQHIEPVGLERIAFEKRDYCRIVFHRDRIPPSAGIQRLRIQAGDFNQILSLAPGSGTLRLSIPVGDRNEYEKVSVSVAHDMLSGHYTLQTQQSLGEEARYRIMLSDSWWRMSATTALPTGMFRFGSGDSEGTVPLSAGVLSRINYIQKDGHDFPLGLETGLFATNLSGQPDFSFVLGAGLSIPVLNPDTVLQASFNIHAWLEYAPTRLARDEGTIAFLFGPSFTVGRLSTTF